MSDDHETTTETPSAAAPDADPVPPAQSRRARWRAAAGERARRTRKGAVLAVAGALLVCGAGGVAIGAYAAGDRESHDRPGRHSGFEDHGPVPSPGVPGQLPPATRDDGGLDG